MIIYMNETRVWESATRSIRVLDFAGWLAGWVSSREGACRGLNARLLIVLASERAGGVLAEVRCTMGVMVYALEIWGSRT